ncbi:hypothetical protein JCM10207_006130 [Rhodosporidiobolus poonsookiae]
MAIPLDPGPQGTIKPFAPVLNPAWQLVDELPQREGAEAPLEGVEVADDDEWEEDEVEYVTLEFAQHLRDRDLEEAGEVQLLSLEAHEPYARIGQKYFRGTHEELIGNDILLMHQPDASPSYQPFATASHRVVFQPVTLTPNSLLARQPPQASSEAAAATPGRGRGRGHRALLAQRGKRKPSLPLKKPKARRKTLKQPELRPPMVRLQRASRQKEPSRA